MISKCVEINAPGSKNIQIRNMFILKSRTEFRTCFLLFSQKSLLFYPFQDIKSHKTINLFCIAMKYGLTPREGH
jgi:hypothetical protein